MRQLRNKRAIITGAAGGIGRAIALHLAAEGVHVCLVDINEQGLDEVARQAAASGVEVLPYVCDVRQANQINRCVRKVTADWPDLDILINNAGVCSYGVTECTPPDVWEQVLGVNLQAPIRFTAALLPRLKQRPEAHILNVCSMYGLFATNRSIAYHTSKFGLVGFTEALRAECARGTVGVTALCPGYVESDLFASMIESHADQGKRPPKWACTTPDHVARRAIAAIKYNRPLVLVTLLAHFGYLFKRMFPTLLGTLYGLGRSSRSKAAAVDQRRAA